MNPATGDFVFGVAEGFLIEDGEVDHAGPRREPDRPRDRGHERGRRRRRRLRHVGGRLRQGRPGRARGQRLADAPDLAAHGRRHRCLTSSELCAAAVDAATGDEAVEAYAEESRHTEASALRGEIEGLTFAESRGVGRPPDRRRTAGLRVRGRPDRRGGARGGRGARARTPRSPSPTSTTCSPSSAPAEPIARAVPGGPGRRSRPTGRWRWRWTWSGGRSRSTRAPRRSTRPRSATRSRAWRSRPRPACRPSTRGPTPGAWPSPSPWRATRRRPASRSRSGAASTSWAGRRSRTRPCSARCACWAPTKPPTAKVPIVLDQFAAMSFLGVLAGALSAEAVLKQRSLFADDGRPAGRLRAVHARRRRHASRSGRPPRRSTTRACPTGRTELFTRRHAERLPAQHVHGASRTGGGTDPPATRSAAGTRARPAWGHRTSTWRRETCRSRSCSLRAEGGVLIQDVSGVHSGANPISGEFSVGATGLRICRRRAGRAAARDDGRLDAARDARGHHRRRDDLRFFSSVGTPSILIGEMTLAGV